MRIQPNDTAFRVFANLALHEGESKTLTQLARAVERSERMTWTALKGLAEDGLVIAEPKPDGTGWGKLYRANIGHPIFLELRQIAIKTLGSTDVLREAILENPVVEAAAIFGSVAAGTDRRTGRLSDIDLLIVFSDESSREQRLALRHAVSAAAERLNRDVNVEALLRSEWEWSKANNRILRRIASSPLLPVKGSINANARGEGPEDPSVAP